MNKAIKYVAVFAAATLTLGVLAFGVFQYVVQAATALPGNHLGQCQQLISRGKAMYLALGDSITHAKVSSDYLALLEQKPQNSDLVFVNGGINGQLAYHLNQQAEFIVGCDPQYITILIGTNDVRATLSAKHAQDYVKQWQLPQTPDLEFFQENLRELIVQLREKTDARIALYSIPPLSEVPANPINKTLQTYNGFIAQLAMQYGLSYLPLNETMNEYLQALSPATSSCGSDVELVQGAVAKYYLLGRSWNSIGSDNNLSLLTDCIHLNDTAGKMVADLAQGFIEASQ